MNEKPRRIPTNMHNAHMILPASLWQKLKTKAVLERKTVTQIVIEACRRHIGK